MSRPLLPRSNGLPSTELCSPCLLRALLDGVAVFSGASLILRLCRKALDLLLACPDERAIIGLGVLRATALMRRRFVSRESCDSCLIVPPRLCAGLTTGTGRGALWGGSTTIGVPCLKLKVSNCPIECRSLACPGYIIRSRVGYSGTRVLDATRARSLQMVAYMSVNPPLGSLITWSSRLRS